MITTLTGPNSFALKAELDRIVSEFVKDYSAIGLQRIDGEEATYDTIREALESLPFLARKKLIVLRTPSAQKEFVEKAPALLSDLPETTDLLLVEPRLDKRSSYYKLLQKTTEYKEFTHYDEHGLVQWITSQADISSRDARYLIERVGAHQQMLAGELAKLQAYDDKITRQTIDLLTEPTPQSTVFQLLDVAFGGNQKRMLELYQEQRASNVEPQAIIGMLAWQLHVLAVVKTAGDRSDADIAREAKLNPFVVRKSRAIANKLTTTKLKQLLTDLTEIDEQLKSISMDADDVLQAYLLGI